MAIIQISKIQQRTGNLVDLPQLDEAQFGWANDAKRLFVGTTTPNPNENVEVLTAYSNINFSQINGSEGNLNISAASAGEILSYDGNNWVNKGGSAGGEINLGSVANITITGGAIGYVLETDGVGNLSWTPKSTITAYISAVTKANPGVVTTTQDNFFTDGTEVTITNVLGMTQLNGNSYYVNVLTSNTFSLYSDSGLSTPVDTTGYTTYISGGRVIASVGGAGTSAAGGSNTTIQFNDNNVIQGNAGFTFNKITGAVAIPGNVTAGNVIGTLVTGTLTTAAQPNVTSVGTLTSLTVTGNITGANLIGNHFGAGTGLTSITGANVTGQVANSLVAGTVYTAAQPNITSVGTLSSLTVSANVSPGGIKTDNYYYANGVSISFAGSYSNSNVSSFLAVYGSNTISTTGNITGGNLIGTHYGAATGLTSIPAANISGQVANALVAGTVYTAAQPNITSTGTLSSLTVSANVATGGIKTDNYYYANGVAISFAGAYSNSNVASYLPTYTGQVGTGAATFYGANLTTGSNVTIGNITGNWTLTTGSRLQATYADLAEYYEADRHYEPGTVLAFGGDKEVTMADDATTKVAGIVSTNPAYVMNMKCPGEYIVALALQGRVPCKVRGNIKKGDMLISAGNGFARQASFPILGTVIGKSLENFDGIEGIIEVAVGRL
jgi:phage tail protein X